METFSKYDIKRIKKRIVQQIININTTYFFQTVKKAAENH